MNFLTVTRTRRAHSWYKKWVPTPAAVSISWRRWYLGVGLWLLAVTANATVIEDFSFHDLVSQSAFIFTGTVQEQHEVLQGGLVYTHVTFSVEQTLKGSAPTPTIELQFVGGKAGNFGVEIAGQFIPQTGKRCLFFVANLASKQVNPLTGWQQGYFPLVQDESGKDFLDMRQRPDLKIPGLVVDPLVAKMQAMGFSADAINAKVPRAYLFSFEDFRAAILDEIQTTAGTAP